MAISILQAIVHQIPKGRHSTKDDTDVVLSTELTPLQPATVRFIVDNIIKIALKQPREVKRDESQPSTTPKFVTEILIDPNGRFIEASQEIAKTLYRSQTPNSPSGILVVARTIEDGFESVLLMKAEHQEGIQVHRDPETGRLDLKHLEELIVGHNSRIYKVALLRLADDETIVGHMVDQQNGAMYADFFLADFLGCQLADKSEVQTKTFMDSAMKHFNEDIDDPEKASRYASGLAAYMQTPATDFQPSEFADTYLEPEDRDYFLDAIPQTVGNNVIRKDLKLITGGGQGIKFIGHGFTIVASQESISSGKIEVTKSDDGSTIMKLHGHLKKIGFGSLPQGSKD
ncbi:nucleoid-associated protein [Arthrobacter sp. NIO-1057]|uniref:nucleoid-associated protein n=1 Tax=Arthrobacter sp. NIO-1057 TaxID=993071 RepID=UPI00071DDED9|nr:nucleoid-associated protein [Arthrobacter sp. NIO-1057]KSU66696.1 hypothetical protein AS038_08540 [Arthrobacter sp. NIO-1057]SCC21509.1 hypothetical protein GA0061084_1738 [Arthrobacter sp. NIO-1057]